MPDYAACEESNLIIRAQRGEQAAKEALIQRYAALLWSLANRLSYGMRPAAEELVQAGYIGFLRAIEKYDGRRETKLITYAVPWILGEMKRVIRNVYTASEWIPLEAESGDSRSLIETLGCSGEMNEEALDLHLAMKRLPHDEQNVICLRYFRDKTQKETAILLRRSQAQVSRLERCALERLKGMLL